MPSPEQQPSSAPAPAWTPPTPAALAAMLPQFEVLSLLGRGGMGAVYYAVQKALDRPVALKLLPAELSAQPGFADRFTREARAMAKLSHPHIVAVHEFGSTAGGHLFFTMEFIEGTTLAACIHKAGLSPEQALVISGQICLALAYAHEMGVVHRDMKPANVLVDTAGNAKVADFGLARLMDPSEVELGHTVTGAVMGTPDYMAPEQKRGMAVDHRADIYSVGVMLYEMLCGRTPQGAFAPPSRVTGCDAGLDRIVEKAMQPAPEERYQSTSEMKADMDGMRSKTPRMKKRALWKWAALFTVAMAVIAAWLALRGPEKRITPPAAKTGWRDALASFARGEIRNSNFAQAADGSLHALRGSYLHICPPGAPPMRNQVLRATVRGDAWAFDIRRTEPVPNAEGTSYGLQIERKFPSINLGSSVIGRSFTALSIAPWPANFDWAASHVVELRAIRDVITAFLDGQEIIKVRDDKNSAGFIAIWAGEKCVVERLHYADLGDTVQIPADDSAPAPLLTVTTAADELDAAGTAGAGVSLREALRDCPPGGRIAFAADVFKNTPQNVMHLAPAYGTMTVDKAVTLDASAIPGGVSIDAAEAKTRIFQVTPTAALTLVRFTLKNCDVTGNDGGRRGTAIDNEGIASLTDCTLANHRGNSGAIQTTGTLTLLRCTFIGNHSRAKGGAIQMAGRGSRFTATLCTFTGNTSSGGGAINLGSFAREAEARFVHCTIAGNSAADKKGSGGGIQVLAGSATLVHCIVAGNSADVAGAENLSGNVVQSGANLVTGDPRLGPIADNGGATQTMALLPGSPAIDAAGWNIANLPFAQNGVERVRDGDGDGKPAADLGAYELPEPHKK